MERTNNPDEGKVRYRKIGGGSLRLKGKIIKPGQTFTAFPEDIPKLFHDVIIPLDKLPVKEEEPTLDVAKTEYKLQSRGSGGWFDVVDGNGKIVSEKALKRTAALDLIKSLEA